MLELEKQMEKLESLIKREAKKFQGIPVALSGGLDSSLLAALVKPEFAVSVELPEGKHNEIEYSKKVVEYLGLKQIIIKPDDSKFSEYFEQAVRAIGRPIPHFNIFPLYCMYQELSKKGVKKLILGDGPDETMCGYTRDLITIYLFGIYGFEAFKNYKPMIEKVLPNLIDAYAVIINKDFKEVYNCFSQEEDFIKGICRTNMKLMRPDMDDMSNGIASHFGIENIRPYQDNQEVSDFMFNLPFEAKISSIEYGKYLLRKIAAKYLPEEIAWRKEKVGGPVYPVNVMRGWMAFGEFDKRIYLETQREILLKNVQYH